MQNEEKLAFKQEDSEKTCMLKTNWKQILKLDNLDNTLE